MIAGPCSFEYAMAAVCVPIPVFLRSLGKSLGVTEKNFWIRNCQKTIIKLFVIILLLYYNAVSVR